MDYNAGKGWHLFTFLPFYLFTFSGVLLDDKKHPRR